MSKHLQDTALGVAVGPFLHYLRFVSGRFVRHGCLQSAGSLTLTTLFALVPIVTIAITAFSLSPLFARFSSAFRAYLFANLAPPAAGKITTVYMAQFAEHAGQLTVVGLGLFVLSALFLMLTIDQTFNSIWAVRRHRSLLKRVAVYLTFLGVGPLVLGVLLTVASKGISLALGWSVKLDAGEQFLLSLLPYTLTTALLALLYRLVPQPFVPWRHALLGGLAVAGAVSLMKSGFAWYVNAMPTFKLVYGAFSAFPIFLAWLYLCWVIILAGAECVAAMPYWRAAERAGHSAANVSWHRFELAAAVLRRLQECDDGSADLRVLSAELHTGYDELARVVDDMREQGWLQVFGLQISLTSRGTLVDTSEVAGLFLGIPGASSALVAPMLVNGLNRPPQRAAGVGGEASELSAGGANAADSKATTN